MTEQYIIQFPKEWIKEVNKEIKRRREPEPYPFTHPIRDIPSYSRVRKYLPS